MKASDLRIGNWIEVLGFVQIKTGCDIDIVSRGGYDGANGIPLTPEILEKCGLVRLKIESVDSYFNGDDILIRIEDMTLFLHSELDGSVWRVKSLQFVHQLQNLYYALTNTELPITL